MISDEILNKAFKEYIKAVLDDSPDVEAKYKTYQTVLENFLRKLERISQ